MRNVYEPIDPKIPESEEIIPNIELLEGRLRLHFYPEGVAFGLVDPHDQRFAVMLAYDEARRMMLEAAEEAAHD